MQTKQGLHSLWIMMSIIVIWNTSDYLFHSLSTYTNVFYENGENFGKERVSQPSIVIYFMMTFEFVKGEKSRINLCFRNSEFFKSVNLKEKKKRVE